MVFESGFPIRIGCGFKVPCGEPQCGAGGGMGECALGVGVCGGVYVVCACCFVLYYFFLFCFILFFFSVLFFSFVSYLFYSPYNDVRMGKQCSK